MSKARSLLVLSILAVMIAVLGYNQVLAGDSDASPGRLIDRREYTREEFRSVSSSEGVRQIPVQVRYLSERYQVGDGGGILFNIDMARGISKWRRDTQCWLFDVESAARTSTDICVDEEVYVQVSTKYPGGETWGDPKSDWFGCLNDTGWEYTTNAFGQGTNDVCTRGDHRVIHGGTTWQYLDQDGPCEDLPFEPSCMLPPESE